MTKRIRKNINAPIKAAEQEAEDLQAEQPQQQQYRPWEVYVIVGIMAMTVVLVAGSWDVLNAQQALMYILLLVVLVLMYAQRRMKMTAAISVWVGRLIIGLLIGSVGIFLYNTYMHYSAS